MTKIPTTQLAKDFHISKVLTGLWQIADMERDGKELDLETTAAAMQSRFWEAFERHFAGN